MKPSRNILFVEALQATLYDESGVVCYEYGNMGEVTNETRIYALPFLSSPVALSTQFTYDSWGRIQNITNFCANRTQNQMNLDSAEVQPKITEQRSCYVTYPDNEVVSYAYDLGGQLQSITNNSSYTYLDNVTYDRFGAKVSQEYGNGLNTQHGKSQQVYLKYLKMPDINVLLMLMLVFLFGCQNGKEFSEINDTLIDGKNPIDSILLDGFDPFFNEDCAMEISKIIKEEIISSLQEENIKQYDYIWFAITFRGTGEILDFKFKNVILSNIQEKELKKSIIKKTINFKCEAIKDLNAEERKKIISWVIPIHFDDNSVRYNTPQNSDR